MVANGSGDSEAYSQAWDALGSLAAAGKSFSGRERNCVFWNTGIASRRFADISGPAGLDFPDDGRGLAVVDWDHDGDLDLWFTNRTAPRVRFMRNDSPSQHHYVAIRLQGRSCNRDAIGARVELYVGGSQPRKLVKSLSAGCGFLSQSSKWLYFGLGDDTTIEQLIVRWPGRPAETFTGLEADRRYEVVQQSGEVRGWDLPRRQLPLEPKTIPQLPKLESARIVLTQPVPLPQTRFSGVDGAPRLLFEEAATTGPRKYLLINLWATWCLPCQRELRELSAHAEQLQAAGLDVLALSVDALDRQARSGENSATKAASVSPGQSLSNQITEYVTRLGFPFRVGVATSDMVNGFEQLQSAIVAERRPLPIPTSVLVNKGGKACVIYRGEITVQQLLEDLALLDATPALLAEAATPFTGRWIARQIDPSPVRSAEIYLEAGYIDEAIEYLLKSRELRPGDAAIPNAVAGLYRDRGNFDQAVHWYRDAMTIDPTAMQARLQLAGTLYLQGKPDAAVAELRKVLAYEPKSIHAANNLAWILATDRDDGVRNGPEAVQLAEMICQLTEYRSPELLDTLSVAYAEVGRFRDASRVIDKALTIVMDGGEEKQIEELKIRKALFDEGHPFRTRRQDASE